jgi:hypothetical protein
MSVILHSWYRRNAMVESCFLDYICVLVINSGTAEEEAKGTALQYCQEERARCCSSSSEG